MKPKNKPKFASQGGYLVAWACFFIASISVVVQARNTGLQITQERRRVDEKTDILRAQLLIIQDGLKYCLNNLQSTASTRSYPVTPPSGKLQDVVCPHPESNTTALWTSSELMRLKPTAGFKEWNYTGFPDHFSLTIESTDGNKTSIAAMNRLRAYVLPKDGEGWRTNPGTLAAPPTWLGERLKVTKQPDGNNWQITFSSD